VLAILIKIHNTRATIDRKKAWFALSRGALRRTEVPMHRCTSAIIIQTVTRELIVLPFAFFSMSLAVHTTKLPFISFMTEYINQFLRTHSVEGWFRYLLPAGTAFAFSETRRVFVAARATDMPIELKKGRKRYTHCLPAREIPRQYFSLRIVVP
jgi:hypothetical protein